MMQELLSALSSWLTAPRMWQAMKTTSLSANSANLGTCQGQHTCQGATPALSRSMGSKAFSSWLMMKTGWPLATSSPKLATYAGSTPQVSLKRSASGCKGKTHYQSYSE